MIQGKSILVNVEAFYSPLLSWMDDFIANPTCKKINFSFDIEYFNLASTKRFMFLLMKLQELKNSGIDVNVQWIYASNDKDALEMGEDMAQMLNIPIELVAYERAKKTHFTSN